MSIVDFNSSLWTDPGFEEISPLAKLLSIYLGTNNHKNTAGLYKISLKRMAAETGIGAECVLLAFEELEGKIKYDSNAQIVWVKDHVRGQFMKTANISDKIVTSILKSLLTLPIGYAMIGEFLEYYKVLHIKYPYPIDKVSIKGMRGVSVGYGYPTGEGEGEGGGVNTSHTDNSLEESKDLKYSYGTYGNVWLTKDEEKELIGMVGKPLTLEYIARIGAHIESAGSDPYNMQHRAKIEKWLIEDGKYKPKKRQGPKLDDEERAKIELVDILREPKSVMPETLRKWEAYHTRWPDMGWDKLLEGYKPKIEPERKSTKEGRKSIEEIKKTIGEIEGKSKILPEKKAAGENG